MLAICDVSADPGGSIGFITECTTIDSPFCLYDADQNKDSTSFKGPGVLVCSIDNMPTQLPREATDFFGDLLLPYVYDIISSNATKPFSEEDFCSEVASAVITSNGTLTPNFEYIAELRRKTRSKHKAAMETAAKVDKVLVLGAGHVSEPIVEYLSRDSTIGITIASALRDEADVLANKYPSCEPLLLDVAERLDHLDTAIKDADLVISLLPYALHPHILQHCINNKTNMVTASYCTPQMKEMHDAAVEAEITVVNEVGLDPGIDHLLALECFNDVEQGGGKVESFVSYCGGLPAPEFTDNPLRYKFSWSPRGVLANTRAAAKYLKDNEIIEIPAGGALLNATEPFDFLPGLAFEGFPNRDSTIYQTLYGIESAKTFVRGTLRYRGFSDVVIGLHKLGLIDDGPHPSLHPNGPEITWRQLVCSLLGQIDSTTFYDNVKTMIVEKVGSVERMQGIESLGLLNDDLVVKCGTPLDTLSHFLSKKLKFDKGERDLVVLRHDVQILWPDGRREQRGINLVCYGEPEGYTAMAKTVGYPAAIAAKMVLHGEIQSNGMVLPFTRDIYKPMLLRLEQEGIKATEKSTWLD